MPLTYKFKKEKLEDGSYVSRPRVLVTLKGSKTSIDIPALIDSGADTSVIPNQVAKPIGLNIEGEKTKIYTYLESTDVVRSKANFIFVGRVMRESVTLDNIPVLIDTLSSDDEEQEIILGVDGIFDNFDITFKKSKNKIIFKRAIKIDYR